MGGHSDLRVLLFVKIAMWAVLCFGLAALVVFKAVSAMREGRRYRFTFLDGGLLFRGKETSPRLMIGVAAAYAFGVSALLAWPLGLYRWVGEATSGCHDVIPMTVVRRFAAGEVGEARVQELGTFCSLRVSSTTYRSILDLEISGYAKVGGVRGSVEMLLPDGTRLRRLDAAGTRTLWLDGRAGGSMSLVLHGEQLDETATLELASLMAARQDVLERYAARWRTRPSPVARALRNNAPWIFGGGVVALLAGGVIVARVRQRRAMRRALDED